MKIHAISFANPLTTSKGSKQLDVNARPATNYYDSKKIRNTLLCIAALGAAGITYALIKDAGNNSVKGAYNSAKEVAQEIIPDNIKIGIFNNRDASAVNKYHSFLAKEKLTRLEEKIANGDFKNEPEHVLKNIEKQKNKLTKLCA